MSFKKFRPECDYTLYPVAIWGEPTDSIRSMFYGTKHRWLAYYKNGCDAGCWQESAAIFGQGDFLVCCTSRVYFHKSGWLERLTEARELHGPGLYSTSASMESKPHLCLRFFGVDAMFMRGYPLEITDRPLGRNLEVGDGAFDSLGAHCRSHGGTSCAVYWNGEHFTNSMFRQPNIFRRGDQSNLLAWDRHTLLYAEASDEEKKRLETLTFGTDCAGD